MKKLGNVVVKIMTTKPKPLFIVFCLVSDENIKTANKTVSNSFKYIGEQYDEETGLIYLRTRYYDPEIGRFITKDPFPGYVRAPQTKNPYPYVGNNPMNFVDPWGLAVLNPNNYPISPAVQQALENYNNYIGQNHDVIITGGDRPASSNLGAGSGSTHAQGIAADIYVPGQPHLQTANQASESGLFGGIGWYEEGYSGPHGEGPHVHVDLRNGTARWGYDREGNRYRGYFPPYNPCK